MGDLAKEPEGLLIFNFFPLKKPLTKSYGTGIGYCQEILVMDTVRNARPDQTKSNVSLNLLRGVTDKPPDTITFPLFLRFMLFL